MAQQVISWLTHHIRALETLSELKCNQKFNEVSKLLFLIFDIRNKHINHDFTELAKRFEQFLTLYQKDYSDEWLI